MRREGVVVALAGKEKHGGEEVAKKRCRRSHESSVSKGQKVPAQEKKKRKRVFSTVEGTGTKIPRREKEGRWSEDQDKRGG